MKRVFIILPLLGVMLAAVSAADAEIIKDLDFFESMEVLESKDEGIVEELADDEESLLENDDEE